MSKVRMMSGTSLGDVPGSSVAGTDLCAPSETESTAATAPEAQPPTPSGKPSILLVDDEVRLLSVNSKLLTAVGMEITTADSGCKALEILRSADVDLVVLDMVMPKMDGVTTLRKMRVFKPDQKVIFLSAYSDPAQIVMAESLGALAYVEKPASLAVLSRVIEASLNGERAEEFRVTA